MVAIQGDALGLGLGNGQPGADQGGGGAGAAVERHVQHLGRLLGGGGGLMGAERPQLRHGLQPGQTLGGVQRQELLVLGRQQHRPDPMLAGVLIAWRSPGAQAPMQPAAAVRHGRAAAWRSGAGLGAAMLGMVLGWHIERPGKAKRPAGFPPGARVAL